MAIQPSESAQIRSPRRGDNLILAKSLRNAETMSQRLLVTSVPLVPQSRSFRHIATLKVRLHSLAEGLCRRPPSHVQHVKEPQLKHRLKGCASYRLTGRSSTIAALGSNHGTANVPTDCVMHPTTRQPSSASAFKIPSARPLSSSKPRPAQSIFCVKILYSTVASGNRIFFPHFGHSPTPFLPAKSALSDVLHFKQVNL